MQRQRQVGMVFDLPGRAFGAARYALLAIPLIASMIAASTSVRDRVEVGAPSGVAALDREAALVSAFVRAAVLPAAVPAPNRVAAHAPREQSVPGETAHARAPASPLKLSPEQRKIAQFVATKYRVAVDDVQHFVAHAYRAAREFRLDPYLVLAVMSIESNFNPNARSSAGAQGLMQVLTRVHTEKFAPFGGASAAFDPMANISVGSRILKDYLLREGSVEGALKSYVGAALLSHDFGYGHKVLSERERIAAAAAGRPIPAQPLKPPVLAGGRGPEAVRIVTPLSGTPGAVKTLLPVAASHGFGLTDSGPGAAALSDAVPDLPVDVAADAPAPQPAYEADRAARLPPGVTDL